MTGDKKRLNAWGDRAKTTPGTSVPPGTLADQNGTTMRFVSPSFAAQEAQKRKSGWDREKTDEISETATTTMSDLPAKIAAQVRAEREKTVEARGPIDIDEEPLDEEDTQPGS
jgi:hypothetical protein